MFWRYCNAAWGPASPIVRIRISAVVLSTRDPHSVKAYQMKADSSSLTTLSQMRIPSEQTSGGRRGDGNLPYRWNQQEIMQTRLCRKHKCDCNRGKLSWQGFPLSKANINKSVKYTSYMPHATGTSDLLDHQNDHGLGFFDWLKGNTVNNINQIVLLHVTHFRSGIKARQLILNVPWQQKFTESVNNDCYDITRQHLHVVLSNRMQCSFSTSASVEIPEIPSLIPPLAWTADECRKGLIQRELKIRLLIFITCLWTAWKTESPPGFRAVVDNGKWFNIPNESFLTVDTAWKGEMRRRENALGINPKCSRTRKGCFFGCNIKNNMGWGFVCKPMKSYIKLKKHGSEKKLCLLSCNNGGCTFHYFQDCKQTSLVVCFLYLKVLFFVPVLIFILLK